jgi:hypothetical protein
MRVASLNQRAPLLMPLILAEALLDPDSAGDRNAADTDTEYSSSSEDEELPKPTQATGFAQRVTVEVRIFCQTFGWYHHSRSFRDCLGQPVLQAKWCMNTRAMSDVALHLTQCRRPLLVTIQ